MHSPINFEILCIYKIGARGHYFSCGYKLLQIIFWKFSFSHRIAWPLCEKSIDHISILKIKKKNRLIVDIWIYFWMLNSIPLVYMSILMPVPHCFDYCSFVVSFERETREKKQDMTCTKHFRKSCDSQGTGSLRWYKKGRNWALVLDRPGSSRSSTSYCCCCC